MTCFPGPGRCGGYARHFTRPGLFFRVADAEDLPENLGTFHLVVASNVMEHLGKPERTLDWIKNYLTPIGLFIMAVPPIVDEATKEENERIRFHHSNLFVWEWEVLLRQRFDNVRFARHLPLDGSEPDFTNPFPSQLSPEAFRFIETDDASDLWTLPTLSAIFVAQRGVRTSSKAIG